MRGSTAIPVLLLALVAVSHATTRVRRGLPGPTPMETIRTAGIDPHVNTFLKSLTYTRDSLVAMLQNVGLLPEKKVYGPINARNFENLSPKAAMAARLASYTAQTDLKELERPSNDLFAKHPRDAELEARGSSSTSSSPSSTSSSYTWENNGNRDPECDKIGVYVHSNYTVYYCNGSVATKQEYDNYMATLPPSYNGTHECFSLFYDNSSCICPVDAFGDDCSMRHTYTCTAVRKAPEPKCEKLPKNKNRDNLLDSDPVCYNVSIKDDFTLEYVIDCEFDLVIEESDEQAAQGFVYEVRVDSPLGPPGVKFALTQRSDAHFKVKTFNFYKMSDDRLENRFIPTAEEYSGDALIKYNMKFDKIDDEFYAGGRLYVEAGFDHLDSRYRRDSVYQGGLNGIVTQRTFVDVREKAIEQVWPKPLSAFAIVAIVLGCLTVVILGGIGATYGYQQYKKKND